MSYFSFLSDRTFGFRLIYGRLKAPFTQGGLRKGVRLLSGAYAERTQTAVLYGWTDVKWTACPFTPDCHPI